MKDKNQIINFYEIFPLKSLSLQYSFMFSKFLKVKCLFVQNFGLEKAVLGFDLSRPYVTSGDYM